MAEPRRRAGVGSADAGTATAELAVAMPAVVLLMAAVAAMGQATVAKISCLDAARAGARAAARGDTDARVRDLAVRAAGGDGAAVVVSVRRGAQVEVEVRRVVRLAFGPSVAVQAIARSQSEGSDPGGSDPGGSDLGGSELGGSELGGSEPASTGSADSGSATVLVLAVAMVAALLVLTAAALGSVLVARHQAQAAADLAALAAAGDLTRAGSCRVAGRLAARNDAVLVGCTVQGPEVTVTAAVRPAGPAGRLGRARARARAGPQPRPG